MSVPNINPEDHGEEISGLSDEQRQAEMDLLAPHAAELANRTTQKLVEQIQQHKPVVPDGGQIGRTLAPRIDRATRIRDGLRLWAPALGTTTGFVVAVSTLPMTGPLAVYGAGLTGFSVWMCAGRPGPVESVRLSGYVLADSASWIKRHTTRRRSDAAESA
ncbi:hypothetical protein IU459_29470 [Nocardia amamiensis]|uniref:DUF3040 domain-containing protein n=1 Tax=Nocardia amamiensis TaxID=404578 RepID=A0ABS0D0J2_9NOCA|nr:hypothetical protein [Nocardia amamiensis]MBF6301638.1 hypothetical protein [Nocardia amamiensis]